MREGNKTGIPVFFRGVGPEESSSSTKQSHDATRPEKHDEDRGKRMRSAGRQLLETTMHCRMMALFCNKKPNCAMFFLRWLGWRVRRPLVKDDIFVGAVEELACNENFVQPMIYNAERVHNSC